MNNNVHGHINSAASHNKNLNLTTFELTTPWSFEETVARLYARYGQNTFYKNSVRITDVFEYVATSIDLDNEFINIEHGINDDFQEDLIGIELPDTKCLIVYSIYENNRKLYVDVQSNDFFVILTGHESLNNTARPVNNTARPVNNTARPVNNTARPDNDLCVELMKKIMTSLITVYPRPYILYENNGQRILQARIRHRWPTTTITSVHMYHVYLYNLL